MRRTAVLNFRNFDKIFEVLRKNGILIFLGTTFIFGLFSGVFSFERFKSFEEIIVDYLIADNIAKSNFFSGLFDSYLNILLVICLSFICGTSMFGVILSPICVSFFGLVYGIFSATIYFDYGFKGIAFYTVMILPGAVLILIALLLAATESFKFSLFLIRQVFLTSPPLNISLVFKDFCFKYLLICLLAFLSALVNVLLSIYLSGKFALF